MTKSLEQLLKIKSFAEQGLKEANNIDTGLALGQRDTDAEARADGERIEYLEKALEKILEVCGTV